MADTNYLRVVVTVAIATVTAWHGWFWTACFDINLLISWLFLELGVATIFRRLNHNFLRSIAWTAQYVFVLAIVSSVRTLAVSSQAPVDACGPALPFLSCAQIIMYVSSLIVFALYARASIFRRTIIIEIPYLLVFVTLFCRLLLTTNHLLVAFFSIIGFSLALYALFFFNAAKKVTREAAVKYYYLSTISSGLMLAGFYLFILTFRTGYFAELWLQNSFFEHTVPSAAALFFIGLTFKLSAVPGHLWAADVYEGAPSFLVFLFMSTIKFSCLIFSINFFIIGLETLTLSWQPLLIIVAGTSLVWGCLTAVNEYKIKRFLAFTSINQIGFTLAALSVNSPNAASVIMLYFFVYILTNACFFAGLVATQQPGYPALTYITELTVIPRLYPRANRLEPLFTIATFVFSSAGVPPTLGFFTKYYVFLTLYAAGYYGLLSVGLTVSLISAFYYIRLIKIVCFEKIPRIFYPRYNHFCVQLWAMWRGFWNWWMLRWVLLISVMWVLGPGVAYHCYQAYFYTSGMP